MTLEKATASAPSLEGVPIGLEVVAVLADAETRDQEPAVLNRRRTSERRGCPIERLGRERLACGPGKAGAEGAAGRRQLEWISSENSLSRKPPRCFAPWKRRGTATRGGGSGRGRTGRVARPSRPRCTERRRRKGRPEPRRAAGEKTVRPAERGSRSGSPGSSSRPRTVQQAAHRRAHPPAARGPRVPGGRGRDRLETAAKTRSRRIAQTSFLMVRRGAYPLSNPPACSRPRPTLCVFGRRTGRARSSHCSPRRPTTC